MIEFQVKDKRFSRCGNRQLPCGARPVFEYGVRETVEFTFDSDLDAQALHTLSGDSMPLQSGEPMLFATGVGTGARKLQFEINTMNQSFLEKCRSFHQKLYLEIAEKKNGSDRILLQDWIECSPRVNVSGTPPEPVTSYYTAAEVDAKLAQISGGGEPPDMSEYAKKSELPQKLSQLENDSAFLSDAPADDALYGRQNGQWTALVATEENYSAAEKAKLAELPSAAELDQRFAALVRNLARYGVFGPGFLRGGGCRRQRSRNQQDQNDDILFHADCLFNATPVVSVPRRDSGGTRS